MPERHEISQEATLRDFLNVIFRRRWLIVGVVALSTAIVVFLNARQPQIYESGAKILVRRGEQSNVFSNSVRYLGWEEEVSSHIEVILSQSVFERAKEIFADSVVALNLPSSLMFNPGGVRADVVGESNAFAIRYVDFDPRVVRIGAEAVTLAFQEYYRKAQAPPALQDFFADQIADVQSDLEMWQEKRNAFLNQEKFYGLDATSKFLLQKVGAVENELTKLEGDISSQEVRVGSLAKLTERSGAELERELAFSGNGQLIQSQVVRQIKFSLQTLRLKRGDLTSKFTDKHPDVVSVDRQIADLHRQLEAEIANAYQVELDELGEMKAKREIFQTALRDARAKLDAIPDQEMELTRIEAAISSLEEKQELLLKRQADAEIAIAGRPDWEVSILTHAGPPHGKRTRDYVRLALGPLLSIIVALGIAFFLENLDHSVDTSAEVEEFFDLPVLTTVSEFRKTDRSGTG